MNMQHATSLPIDSALPDLRAALEQSHHVILQAPPGAGKTTRVPLALLPAEWLQGGRILMLEPRRLAARAAASWMATLLGEEVGGTVGYRVRLDSRVGPRTRIEVVTEGVLTRMLQEDPALERAGIVIFDEFHERSIHADTGLALTLQAQALLRPDLRVLVMSATLETEPLLRVLPGARVIRSEGRAFPVETVYLPRPLEGHVEPTVARIVATAHERQHGDILVFLPGAAEIRRTAERLDAAGLPPTTRVIRLHGELPREEQDRAIAPSRAGTRKIVLATAIAETSITIEGVRVVVDSGLMRVPRFSPRTGMTGLATVPVTRAAADQRRGRAGRVAEGTCYRLWTEQQHGALLAQRPPEILEADLAPLALDLAVWGVSDPAELRWIDEPPAAAFRQARELLRELQALDDGGVVTEHGRALAALPLHPRLAHMLVSAERLHATGAAADMAALLSERDVLRAPEGLPDPDLRLRIPLLHGGGSAPHGHTIDRAALHRARAEAQLWRRRLRARDREADDETIGLLLALAYPDRIAQLRTRGRFQLRNGAVALIDAAYPVAAEPMLAVGAVGGHGREMRIYHAAPLSQQRIEQELAAGIERRTAIQLDDGSLGVRAVEQRTLGALVLSATPLRDPQPGPMTAALLDLIRRRGLALLPWTEGAHRLRQRLAFLHAHDPAWPDVADAALLATLEEWLAPWLGDVRRSDVLRTVDLAAALLALPGWERRTQLDRLAPTHIEVPSGSRIPVDYSDPLAPVLAVRLQEMFGALDTPRVADGRVPLTLHLLSPAQRPVQVTRDLASFWRTGYFDVRRDLRGRYPKHYWPDDPLTAQPTRRTRPR